MTEQEAAALERLTTILYPLLTSAIAEAETILALLDRGTGAREVACARTHTQEAGHWLLDASHQLVGRKLKVLQAELTPAEEAQPRQKCGT